MHNKSVLNMNNHNFILRESGELFVFGHNTDGQLGLDDNENRYVPTLLMQDQSIRQVVCGENHSFIFKETGELFAFGNNQYGQLGLYDNINRDMPTLVMKDKTIN